VKAETSSFARSSAWLQPLDTSTRDDLRALTDEQLARLYWELLGKDELQRRHGHAR